MEIIYFTPKASKAAILTLDFLLIKGSNSPLASISVKCKSISLLFMQNSDMHLQALLYTSLQGSIAKALNMLHISSK